MGDPSPSGGRLPLCFAKPKSSSFAPAFGQHDVARLQISVDNTLSMGLVQGHGDFDGNF